MQPGNDKRIYLLNLLVAITDQIALLHLQSHKLSFLLIIYYSYSDTHTLVCVKVQEIPGSQLNECLFNSSVTSDGRFL